MDHTDDKKKCLHTVKTQTLKAGGGATPPVCLCCGEVVPDTSREVLMTAPVAQLSTGDLLQVEWMCHSIRATPEQIARRAEADAELTRRGVEIRYS